MKDFFKTNGLGIFFFFLSILGIDKIDEFKINSKDVFQIYADKSEPIYKNDTVEYITKFYIKNDFSKIPLDTANNKIPPYINFTSHEDIQDFYIIKKDDIKVQLNYENNKLFININGFEYKNEFFIYIKTKENLDLNKLLFNANLDVIKSHQDIENPSNHIFSKYWIYILFIIIMIPSNIILYKQKRELLILQAKEMELTEVKNENNILNQQIGQLTYEKDTAVSMINIKDKEIDEIKKSIENIKNQYEERITMLENEVVVLENDLSIFKVIYEENSTVKIQFDDYKIQFDNINNKRGKNV